MSYSYFGNTSAKEAKLLINIEAHLILLNQLFKTATDEDRWVSNSSLQLRYVELLKESKLLNSNEMELIAKNARTKVSFLKDLGLVDFENLKITEIGNELLHLLDEKKFEEKNEFLQIDLVSLFFLKYFFRYKKNHDIDNMFLKYLYIFKKLDGKLTDEQFYLLPLISNYENIDDFVELLEKGDNDLNLLFKGFIDSNKRDKARKEVFLADYRENGVITNLEPFATSKGTSFVQDLPYVLEIFKRIKNKSYSKADIRNIFSKKIDGENNDFRKLYLPTMLETTSLAINNNTYINLYRKLFKIVRSKGDDELLEYFFDLIYTSRYFNNLRDYKNQNTYYLNLTGIFTFVNGEVKISEIFNVILKSSKYENILKSISETAITKDSLNHLFGDEDVKTTFETLGVDNAHDLNMFQYNKDKEKLQELLCSTFTKEKVKELFPCFKIRDDKKIQEEVTIRATVPTIFEYVTALAWCYIDNNNIDFILKAGLSLDANMLPKSHAVGGSSDFKIEYDDHTLMIEVTLTESTNQRRAEMESVSRHLGNILLELDEEKQEKSYGIFIAPHLNKNVLNDFRTRKLSYWENETNYIKGMNIIPLDTDDVVNILNSNIMYSDLRPKFYEILKKDNDWGSKWYNDEVKPFIRNLIIGN